MNVEELQLEVDRHQSTADRFKNLGTAFKISTYGGAAILGYGVIDSVVEQAPNIAPTVVGLYTVLGSAALSITSKVWSDFNQSSADLLNQRIEKIETNRRARNHEHLKLISIGSRRSLYY